MLPGIGAPYGPLTLHMLPGIGAPYGPLTLHMLPVSVHGTVVKAFINLKPLVLGRIWNLPPRLFERLNKTKQISIHA